MNIGRKEIKNGDTKGILKELKEDTHSKDKLRYLESIIKERRERREKDKKCREKRIKDFKKKMDEF